ncbi:rhodanese-like domain-containing protein [Aestuariibaculum sp. YM273]|uniref:rhodanese-like domain-containing protein n=1 Tax=Aestuariibaculum sp. YM273 TaxID=3070659 RepID=UPI0027DC50FC|nr:rhodanese-like domain-containing protein [Aestuariibaculum sp. YM273]WMI66750.1 rhodanese-like domain-containing protein [Aestuariibaculum sp. YM273]
MNQKKTIKFPSNRYQILAVILVILAGGLLLLPKYDKQEGIRSKQLLSHAISPERYISTDQLSHILISQDPSFILVDVRDESSYNSYALPNAINIPLPKLLDEDSLTYLNQDQFDVVFYSNDTFLADQAWMLCDRLGFKNLHVLKGGLNIWYTTIINPTKPNETMPEADFKLYATRKAASMYYGVAYPDQNLGAELPTVPTTPKKVITVEKKKKRKAEGGC